MISMNYLEQKLSYNPIIIEYLRFWLFLLREYRITDTDILQHLLRILKVKIISGYL